MCSECEARCPSAIQIVAMTTDSRQRIIGLNEGFPWPVTDDELLLYDEMNTAMRYFDLPQDEGSMPAWSALPGGDHGGLAAGREKKAAL